MVQSRKEFEEKLIARAQADESFRQALLTSPKATIEEELGASLPENVEIKVVEETADTLYLVLPAEEGELSDADLEAVSGGIIAVLIGRAEQSKGRGITSTG
jgi:hypothetical protein